jgi:hypothetical protein
LGDLGSPSIRSAEVLTAVDVVTIVHVSIVSPPVRHVCHTATAIHEADFSWSCRESNPHQGEA